MVAANWHTYQVLTKRSERVRDLLTGRLRLAAEQANVWWGVSVEDRHFGVPRIGHLQQARSAVSFYPSNRYWSGWSDGHLGNFLGMVGGESGPLRVTQSNTQAAEPLTVEWKAPIS